MPRPHRPPAVALPASADLLTLREAAALIREIERVNDRAEMLSARLRRLVREAFVVSGDDGHPGKVGSRAA